VVQLRRDAHEQLHVQVVVVGHERLERIKKSSHRVPEPSQCFKLLHFPLHVLANVDRLFFLTSVL
jgi:hypothetical protein